LRKNTRLEEKRALILREARKVLVKHGKDASMADIARALDMDKSSLYYYFKGIPEILNTILDQEYYDFSVRIQQRRGSADSPLDVLKGMVLVILEFYHDNLEILEIILTLISPLFFDLDARHDSVAINQYMESYWLANRYMLEEIERAIREGQIDQRLSPEFVLQTLRGAIFGICSLWRKEKPGREMIPQIIDRFFRMYA
jgi:AcrR family transcriptional regulator